MIALNRIDCEGDAPTMARYKPIDLSPRLIPVDFSRHVLPGSFEYALCHVIDHELDLTACDARHRNDEVGAPAYAPALVLKIGLDRFTLRGRDKVDGQWKLFCMVHNIERLANHGYGR